jgi:nitrate reductase alpha subunit
MSNGNPVISRRTFLSRLALATAGAGLWTQSLSLANTLNPTNSLNPLLPYPNREWEENYRNLYRSDSKFAFLCAPNDTHNCLLWAHVKNGTVTRISPTYRFKDATDLEGNQASSRWDPRCCQRGLALVRRFYGDRRIKRPMVRKGFKEWVDAGFPRDPISGAVDEKYLQRGPDPYLPVSWDEAFEMEAKTLQNIAQTYNGKEGQEKLLKQHFEHEMVDATQGVGTQVLKFRGGMPPLGMTRVFAQYRFANAMALLDASIRGTGPADAVAARGWDNYSWHTDLPPGHPMVTGQQTLDWDLCNVEHSKLIIIWGMNWITTKMPDSHWLTEARLKGTKVVVISVEYSATANKADAVLIVRCGTTPALALGIAQVLIQENLFDAEYVRRYTDLPALVRMDTGAKLLASEVFPNHIHAPLTNNTTTLSPGTPPPIPHLQSGPIISDAQRAEWSDLVMWDSINHKPVAVDRDHIGKHFDTLAFSPLLSGSVTVTLANGQSVTCRTVFDVTQELLDSSYTPEQVSKITWAPADAIRTLAREIANNKEKTLFACGMGPNQYFNSDLKDRGVFLVAALSRNIGHFGGNVGSYAGNYRGANFNGLPHYISENPFDIELDPNTPVRIKKYWKAESVHYWNHGDEILKMGDTVLTGHSHLPTPTKSVHVSNSNSLIGNAKGHYDAVFRTFKRVEMIAINEWWWTASCDYADIVYAVDSWAEMRYPDMSISVTNPFLYVFPTSPLPRIHDTRSDVDVASGVCAKLATLINDNRLIDYWHFAHADRSGMRTYIQRILDYSNATRGYTIADLEAKAQQGIPAILQSRTYPKCGGWEQANEDKPWYTKSGRLEFYRDEPEFMDSGENLVIHREPIDSTFHEPNVIVANPHPLLRPKSPEDYGVDRTLLHGDARQARHVILNVEQLLKTQHPLMKRNEGFNFIFHTPKYRHAAHTTAVDTDIVAIWFGPFGDMFREDRRKPYINENYVDINPLDAKELGIEDGDYVFIDADPGDRPFRGWQKAPKEYQETARLLCRARYYPGTPRRVTRMWHNMSGATYGSVQGAKSHPTGLARNPNTGYQAMLRAGSHQSCTRGWLKPTWMTDTLVVKELLDQTLTHGFVPDVHCPTGAPREAFVKITKAEDGGLNGKGLWLPAQKGLRPTYETDALKAYIAGKFILT